MGVLLALNFKVPGSAPLTSSWMIGGSDLTVPSPTFHAVAEEQTSVFTWSSGSKSHVSYSRTWWHIHVGSALLLLLRGPETSPQPLHDKVS